MKTKNHVILWSIVVPLLLVVAVLSLNDAPTPPSADAINPSTLEGRVIESTAPGVPGQPVESATITASTISTDGSLNEIDAEATTDAEGRFSIDIPATADVVVLRANKETFASQVLVVTDASYTASTGTIPMSEETNAEADVYVEAARQGKTNVISVADVTVYVTDEIAARIESGTVAPADVVQAIAAAEQAMAAYTSSLGNKPERGMDARMDQNHDAGKAKTGEEAGEKRAEVDEAVDEMAYQNKRQDQQAASDPDKQAYWKLQTELHAAMDEQARADALMEFHQSLVESQIDSDISPEDEARARQSGSAALVMFFPADDAVTRHELRRQGELLSALATAQAIEAAFHEQGVEQDRIDRLNESNRQFIARLKVAETEVDIVAARDEYRSSVRAETASELNVEESRLSDIESELKQDAGTLKTEVSKLGTADEVASRYVIFFPEVESTAESSLSDTQNAEWGASVLALIIAA